MARLVLDPMGVLSAWEKMGGSAFASDDAHLDDPTSFTLDLSNWESSFKPLAASSAASRIDTNIFTSLFTPAEMSLGGFLPGCCNPAPLTCESSPQVVPICSSASLPAPSEDCLQLQLSPADAAAVLDDDYSLLGQAAACSPFDTPEDIMALQFPADWEVTPDDVAALASPSHSGEAGVVPVLGSAASLLPAEPCCTSAETNAGGALTRLATGSAASALPPSFFVPVCGRAEGLACGLQSIKQEPSSDSEPEPPFPSSTPASEAAYDIKEETPAEAPAHLGPPLPPSHSLPARQPSTLLKAHQTRSQAATGAPASAAAVTTTAAAAAPAPPASPSSLPSGSVSGSAVHIRTRAECLERYRQKKARRMFTKKIRYQLRKINADKRPRIKGRFVKKEELAEFLAAQRAGGCGAGGEGCDDGYPFLGADMMDSDDE
ncbi:hypothetical protein Agub_g12271 [Astrephomene gubernaculifera]|uniref:CCT domain-containing protein n=1 Tax=Astrephomene gubernaculifera TaxID=47775 RepID=A0AAD3HRD2_9CHLO|nr:hypothetical protein Agub_g12271 [Astrephomene gubernaculifera]